MYQFRASAWRKSGAKIGKRVFIGSLAYIDGQYPHLITIEDDASIGPHAIILAHSDGSPYHQQTGIFKQPPRPVHIKRGAWICAGAIVLPGVTVGVGSIVAAGAVVNRDIPDFSVAVGNPARVTSRLPKPREIEKEKRGETTGF
jgi:acetyltransferase-like isoleucine patch superfamily enzyme